VTTLAALLARLLRRVVELAAARRAEWPRAAPRAAAQVNLAKLEPQASRAVQVLATRARQAKVARRALAQVEPEVPVTPEVAVKPEAQVIP
jgi:hypothetical protein